MIQHSSKDGDAANGPEAAASVADRDQPISRRDFVRSCVAGGVAASLGGASWAAEGTSGEMI